MTEQQVVWQPNSRPQYDFCAATENEVFYGGAKGCAKSDAVLMAALQQMHLPRYKALILRQTFPEVQELIDRSHRIFTQMQNPPAWSGSLKRWTWSGGGVLQFGYCKTKEEVRARLELEAKAYYGDDVIVEIAPRALVS